MKYGETFQQRSVPVWANYNLDYTDLKHLIKAHTTQPQGQARTIPGSKNETKATHGFEDELYRELQDQHQRIDLFVQTKAGEIARRLSHLEKQIAQLKTRNIASKNGKLPIRRLEKFVRVEEVILKAGEEIQSLSRFVGAQRLAFQKLLKKYKKWTGSTELGSRFRKEVLDRPASFSKRSFEPLVAQWSELLASFRSSMNEKVYGSSNTQVRDYSAAPVCRSLEHYSPQQGDGVEPWTQDLLSAWHGSSDLDMDTALAVTPLGIQSSRAVYWVHPDNLVQLHVLLLKYTRIHKSHGRPTFAERSSSPALSHVEPVNARRSSTDCGTDDQIGFIMCDDLESFAKRRSSETVNVSENTPGSTAEKAAATLRYSLDSEVDVVVDICKEPSDQSPTYQTSKKAKFKRSAIAGLFNSANTNKRPKADRSNQPEQVSTWLAEHGNIQPLVQIQSKRTRFVDLGNSRKYRVWATLDKDILVRRCSLQALAKGDAFDLTRKEGTHRWDCFPHAILEVRVDGDGEAELLTMLDSSYLTERVRGFSLETHAVATLYEPCSMPPPFWLPALAHEIRKVPSNKQSPKGPANQASSSPQETSSRHTSSSGPFSQNELSNSSFSKFPAESSATSAPEMSSSPPLNKYNKKRRRSQRQRLADRRLKKDHRPAARQYWNEFDDGSEGSGNESYTIYVDPNSPPRFPGAITASRFFSSIGAFLRISKQKVRNWFDKSSPSNKERKPLLNSLHSPSLDSNHSDDDDTSSGEATKASQRQYSTFPPPLIQPPAVRARETLLFRSCISSFAASFLLLFIATILETTGRRKAEIRVDIGVVIGVASSLAFALIAVGSMIGRRDELGWVHRLIVWLVFLCVCLGSVILLAALNDV